MRWYNTRVLFKLLISMENHILFFIVCIFICIDLCFNYFYTPLNIVNIMEVNQKQKPNKREESMEERSVKQKT